MEADRIGGRVTWFNQPKGYGYLRTDGGDDVYVHHSALEVEGFRTLTAGQRVSFTAGDDGRGPTALAVRIEASDRNPAEGDGA